MTDQEAPTRGAKFSLGLEFRIVIPAQAEIERQRVVQPPVVLHEECGVVVAQMNLVVSRRESAGVGQQIHAGGGGAESREVVSRRKQLILQKPRVDAVDHRPQEVHAELHIVAAKELVDAGVERRVLLIEEGRGSLIAEGDCREIAENGAGREGAPRVVGAVERCPGQVRLRGLVALSSLRNVPRSVKTYGLPGLPSSAVSPNPRSSRLASVSFRAEGRLDADDNGRKLRSVTVGVVHLLAQLVLAGALIELGEHRVSESRVGTSNGAS